MSQKPANEMDKVDMGYVNVSWMKVEVESSGERFFF